MWVKEKLGHVVQFEVLRLPEMLFLLQCILLRLSSLHTEWNSKELK